MNLLVRDLLNNPSSYSLHRCARGLGSALSKATKQKVSTLAADINGLPGLNKGTEIGIMISTVYALIYLAFCAIDSVSRMAQTRSWSVLYRHNIARDTEPWEFFETGLWIH